MASPREFALHQDLRGAGWDLLLYVPTVIALASVAAKLWFGGEQSLAYLLSFLASFFCLVGANRILRTRLLLLPQAPVALDVQDDSVRVRTRSGAAAVIVRELRYYSDFSGRSFGLSGLDGQGSRLQFVFHRGQFGDPANYGAAQDALRRLDTRTRRVQTS